MFIPLAPTTSTISTPSSPTPSPLTSPLDDGITTVKHYIYIHTQNPKTNATTKEYHFNWQENIKCNSHFIYTSTCPYRCCPEVCGYYSRAIATHREAKLVFMQGIVKRILREAYREPTTPPSVGTPLAQSVFAGVPPPSRGPSPYFVTQPNYHNGQFHQYYPLESQSPIHQTPATSAHTISPHSTGMHTDLTSVTSTTSSTSTISRTPSTTVHCSSHAAVSREAHRTLTVFAPIALVESLTKTNLLLVADMKSSNFNPFTISCQLYPLKKSERNKHKHLRR